MPEFKAGDVVKLLSGGPKMTVKSPHEYERNTVVCLWFEGDTLHEGSFSAGSLQTVSSQDGDPQPHATG